MQYSTPAPPPLFDRPATTDRIAEDFARFNELHPDVYQAFKRYALQLRGAGRARGSARDVLGRVRWETQVNPSYRNGGAFKVNNNFAAIMARKLMAERPEFDGFFEVRERKSVGVCSGY